VAAIPEGLPIVTTGNSAKHNSFTWVKYRVPFLHVKIQVKLLVLIPSGTVPSRVMINIVLAAHVLKHRVVLSFSGLTNYHIHIHLRVLRIRNSLFRI